jgi:hypothetical protein
MFGRLVLAGSSWLLGTGCQAVFGDFSIDTSKLDALCTPDDLRCTFASLQRCQADGMTWSTVEQCASSTLCDKTAALCVPPTCALHATRCNGDELQRCQPDRSRWNDVQACTSPQLCDPAAASGCSDGPCQAHAVRCNDLALEKCTGGVWLSSMPCVTPELCDATGSGSCRAPLCAAGEQRCLGSATLQTCKASLDGWTETTCPATQHCDSSANQCQ